MRPSAFTDGNSRSIRNTGERPNTSFNEAVGFHRRKPAPTVPTRAAGSRSFNEAVGFHRRKRDITLTIA